LLRFEAGIIKKYTTGKQLLKMQDKSIDLSLSYASFIDAVKESKKLGLDDMHICRIKSIITIYVWFY